MAYCAECGEWFYRDPNEHWKKLCLDCWRTKKANDDFRMNRFVDPEGRVGSLQRQLAYAQDEIARLQTENTRIKEIARKLALAPPGGTAPVVDTTTWRFLMTVAHPDRNGNSEVSNSAARFLLSLRASGRGGR